MKQVSIITALTAIAAANPEGYTVDARTLQPVTTGFAVAVSDTQNSFGPAGLAKVVEYASTHSEINAFGGWLDTETGLYYYDATVIVNDIEEAARLARANGQIAFFDLANLQEVRI